MSRRVPSEQCEDEAMEPRVRTLEVNYAAMAQQVDSLFDNGHPGLLSQIRNALIEKIEFYFAPVSEFIKDEPRRKAHIENNAHQAVVDAKELALNAVAEAKTMAKEALQDAEREQNRMHLENRRTSEKTESEVGHLRESFSRHEKFVQRGIGVVIFINIVVLVGGFGIAALTFIGGMAWWVFTHIPITK